MKKDISVEELKMIQLKILDSIDDFCKKNGMQYFLFSGTLIGAVRHKGYIPWDDDVDICMKRKDYDRFFSEFNQQRRDTLKSISAETEKNYYLASGKVIDTATVIEEENNCAMPIGVYVDIFPMDNLPSDDKKLKKLNHRIDIYRKMLILKEVFPCEDFAETAELEFEGKTYSVPKNYKHVLSNMYGDYMKLPPKEKQVSHHHFTAYWK